MNANVLTERHRALAEHFEGLRRDRGELPVFAIEHGLNDQALEELKPAVSRALEEDPHLSGAVWSWSYLPLIVVATEVGYRYRGTGTDFWPVLSQEIRSETGHAFRTGLSRLFELGHQVFRLVRPGNSQWERHFPHISWPIGNSVVPLEIQPQLTDALRRALRAGVSADDTDRLLDYLRTLAAGHASRRFEHWLLQKDVALEVMRRLLDTASAGWLSESFLTRIDQDIRRDWGAFRALTEARKAAVRRNARFVQIAPARYVFALKDGAPEQLIIRGPVLPSQQRDEVIAALRIHGDRIRAIDGVQARALGSFLAGGEITLKNIFPFPSSPLRRDDSLTGDEGTAEATLARLQPLEPEFFLVEPDGLTAHAVFPEDRLQPGSRIIQCIGTDDDGTPQFRTLETSVTSDVGFLRRRGYVIPDRASVLQLTGMPAPASSDRFLSGFPVLVTQRGAAVDELLLDGSPVSGEILSIRGVRWKTLPTVVGRHLIEPAGGQESDGLEFEVIEPPDVEPARVQILPVNANVSDLEAGNLQIRITAPLPLEAVPIRIRVVAPGETALVASGVIERLPTTITGRSQLLCEIQDKLAGLRPDDFGLRVTVEVEGLLEKVFPLPPVRREIRYDGDADVWKRSGEEERVIPSITATIAAPLLHEGSGEMEGTRLILPDAPDHEALPAGLILTGQKSTLPGLGNRSLFSLPKLLREPTSSRNGVGLIEVARASVAWQLAETNDLLSNWQRWAVVNELEAALVEQLCGAKWRKLEKGIDLSVLSPHGALLRSAEMLGLVSGRDLPDIETALDREFLRDRLMFRLREAVPDIPEALLQWNDDLAGGLDLAVIEAYEDLRQHLEMNGTEAFEEVDMSRPAERWHQALTRSLAMPLLQMFRPFILPEARWSALMRPVYSDLTEDDLVDLLDATHIDAFRRPGFRWLGRPELRTMLQLWLSPKTMVETEDWRALLEKGLSDIRTSRAVRYVALRRKLALGDLPNGSAS